MKKFFLKICFLAVISTVVALSLQASRKWTIMIFLDGDNNLEKYAVNDFLEIASVGSTSEVSFVVQFDRISGYDSRFGNWTNTQRFLVNKNMNPEIGNAISDWGDGYGGREVNSGDPQALASFVRWAKQNFPAQYYALILWDHGDGWRTMSYVAENIEQQLRKNGLTRYERESLKQTLKELKRKIYSRRYQKSICFDQTSSDYLTLKEIRQALSDPDCFVDIIGFDACLMGMIEVAYEIRNCATYMVSSEETIYTTGFPYNTIAQDIVANPDYTPYQLAEKIVQHYADYYRSYGTETLSAINLSFCDDIFNAINNLCQTAINIDNQWLYFYLSLSQSPSFDDPDYKDMKTFFKNIFDNATNPEIVGNAGTIISIFDTMLVANFGEPKGKGLSIYLPDKNTGVDPAYNSDNLEFADGMWRTFLGSLYASDMTKGFTALLYENFNSGLPADWTIIDGNNDGKTWTDTNPGHRLLSNLSEPFMIVDSDWAGRVWMNEELITKTVQINPSRRHALVFDHYFLSYGSEIADIDIKINNEPWQNIKRYQYQDASGTVVILLDQYFNKSDTSYIQIRWNYRNAYDAFYWAIDNVYLLVEGISTGDINKDGIIDISDVILCLRASIGLQITINGQIYQPPYPAQIIEACDIDGSSTIDITDVILILRLSLGIS